MRHNTTTVHLTPKNTFPNNYHSAFLLMIKIISIDSRAHIFNGEKMVWGWPTWEALHAGGCNRKVTVSTYTSTYWGCERNEQNFFAWYKTGKGKQVFITLWCSIVKHCLTGMVVLVTLEHKIGQQVVASLPGLSIQLHFACCPSLLSLAVSQWQEGGLGWDWTSSASCFKVVNIVQLVVLQGILYYLYKLSIYQWHAVLVLIAFSSCNKCTWLLTARFNKHARISSTH